MSYSPRAGSVGERALEQLRLVDGRMSQVDLADAVDVDSRNLQSNIVMCLQAGLIKREVAADGPWYSLGDGVPLPELAAPQQQPVRPAVVALAPIKAKRVPKRAKREQPAPEKAPKPVVAKPKRTQRARPAPVVHAIEPPKRTSLACACTREGQLLIDLGSVFIKLTGQQTEELDRYLADRRSLRALG